MSSINEFLTHLRKLDVKLWADGERLRCNAPEGVLTPELRARLAERKAEILTFLSETHLSSQTVDEPIQRIPRDGPLPLSFAQERLWFVDQLEGQSIGYNMPVALRFIGHLHIKALEESFNEIIRRHDVLRTTFEEEDGKPVQHIAPTLTISLHPEDLRAIPGTQREASIQQRIRDDAQRAFDLRQRPLFRLHLLQVDEAEYVLFTTIHHIIFDGWSRSVLVKELIVLYEAFVRGNPSPLPDLAIQYVDFAQWQRTWLQGETLDHQLAYWTRQLSGELPVLELPTDHPRPARQTFQGADYRFVIPQPVCSMMEKLNRQEQLTDFMTLFTAFAILLYRYTGQEDILVGSPIANRNRADIEQLIGFFVNTIVLRADLSENPTIREVLRRIRQISLEAQANQDLPFDVLVRELQPARTLQHNPLFQVMFVLQNMPSGKLELPDLTILPVDFDDGLALFDLNFVVEETEGRFRGRFIYNTALFDAATIERMATHFQQVLTAVVEDPDLPIARISMLTAAEREQVLQTWNATQTQYPDDVCIHQLVERQAASTPDALAVCFEEQRLTYSALDSRANQLAHYLRERGVGPDTLIGICVERSPEMIVGTLGILKAGGAYLPLDPNYPAERLAFMLSDAQVPLILTQQKLVDHLPEHQAQVICLDSDWDRIAQKPSTPLICQTTPENLAYIIYTSGSTGTPKGTLVPHQGLCNLALAQQRCFDVNPGDRLLQFVSFSFDVATGDIFTTLCAGATLCLASREALLPGPDLLDLLDQQAITHLGLPGSILAALPYKDLPALRVLMVGGEVCPPETVQQWSQGRRFFNAYGPTEATICATMAEYRGDPRLPIGRPLDNVQLYILDHALQPVPVGVPGELYIGGVGVARGYLNRPELTSEQFIPHPFDDRPGARLYKTGDLVRYRPDGNIEFLGRVDQQVKIRGFRVELREIETVLFNHPAVHEAVVLIREDHPGDKRLVAYIVAEQNSTPESSELRHLLQDKLPDYMVPSNFVMLNTFPLTPNGKVDRRALPAPDALEREVGITYIAPRTPTEKTLAAIWADVLSVKKIGIHDNFFELGGHSLLAVQVVSRIRDVFDLELPLHVVFEIPDIANLAEYIITRQLEDVERDELEKILAETEELSDAEAAQQLYAEDE